MDESQYQIIPDSSRYRQDGDPQDWARPANPLDELAFLYYLRTVPLKPGATYQIPRYFKTGYNPVQVRVTGRETLALPGGGTAPVLALEITVAVAHDERRADRRRPAAAGRDGAAAAVRAGHAGAGSERGWAGGRS